MSKCKVYIQKQRRLDSRPQSIMGIERLIPRAASLTVDCRGVNISLTKPIWKLSNDKSVRLRYFVKRNSMLLLYCCDHHYNLCFTIPSLPFFKLYGTCCHFSFINNPSERRKYICVYIPNSEALLSKLDDVKSPCITVKTSAVFKVGILQCITVYTLLFSQIIIRFAAFNLVL